jgi:hypothetical protein
MRLMRKKHMCKQSEAAFFCKSALNICRAEHALFFGSRLRFCALEQSSLRWRFLALYWAKISRFCFRAS